MMRKLLILLSLFVFSFLLHESSLAVVGVNFDIRLKMLLNDETAPFLPDSIRYNFIEKGMQKCAILSDYVAQRQIKSVLAASAENITAWSITNGRPKNVLAIWLASEEYALSHINAKDIALKKIATSESARYWYRKENSVLKEVGEANYGPSLTVYPPNGASVDTAIIFLSYIPYLVDTMNFHPAFENEVVLWALALCKERRGEYEIANFLKQIATNEILDLKAILENRRMDVTIAKEVVGR